MDVIKSWEKSVHSGTLEYDLILERCATLYLAYLGKDPCCNKILT